MVKITGPRMASYKKQALLVRFVTVAAITDSIYNNLVCRRFTVDTDLCRGTNILLRKSLVADNMTPWDIIIVGGGISGSVIASRVKQRDANLKVLLIEAGPDTRGVESLPTNLWEAFESPYNWAVSRAVARESAGVAVSD